MTDAEHHCAALSECRIQLLSGKCPLSAVLTCTCCCAVSVKVEGVISLLAVMGFVLGFSQGSGPIPWVYLGEILPSEIKGPAAALCTSLNWASNLIVGLTFPAMLAGLHLGGAYLVYAVGHLMSCLNSGGGMYVICHTHLPKLVFTYLLCSTARLRVAPHQIASWFK